MEGIIIYVIIGVIYFVAKFLGKKDEDKKPKGNRKPVQRQNPSQEEPTQKTEPAPNLEDIFGELLGIPSEKPKKKAKPKPQTIEKDPFELMKEKRAQAEKERIERTAAEQEKRATELQNEIARREKVMDDLAKSSLQVTDINAPKGKKSAKRIRKNFNLRDAVISKIILDRPYL